jgi:hypothetical protein
MHQLPLMRFRIYLATPEAPETAHEVHDLVVIPADRMKAERLSTQLLAPSQRGKSAREDHAETWALLWLWCAATRAGVTAQGFEDFTGWVLDYDRLKLTDDGQLVVVGGPDDTDDDDLEAEDDPEVGPTRPVAGTTSP